MADFVMLTTVKLALGITGDYQDGALQVYIDEVNEYLRAAGVPSDVIGTKAQPEPSPEGLLTCGITARVRASSRRTSTSALSN